MKIDLTETDLKVIIGALEARQGENARFSLEKEGPYLESLIERLNKELNKAQTAPH